MISKDHAALLDKRERAILVMTKKAGGFRYKEICATYPGLFTKVSQFNNFMRQLIIKHHDLNKRTTAGGATAYFLQANFYRKWSRIWDRHGVQLQVH